MRKHAKLLANFLGATKELTNEFVDLAEITDTELNQISFTVMKRDDRKTTAKMLAAKGLSTRAIAEITGWSHVTIANDLAVKKRTETVQNLTPDPPATPSATGGSSAPRTGGAAVKARRAEVAQEAAAQGVTEEPATATAARYRIIYADPPWDYGAHAQPDYQTEQRDHYPVMDIAAICALPVANWAENDAVLFLWVTSPILEKSFAVVRAWGFEYKASFVWDKIKHNMGHYNSVRHELLLICTRGACQPDRQQLFDSVQSIERGKHSAKPVEFYDIIETLYTHGRKLEMFARAKREGWDAYGHVAEMAEDGLSFEEFQESVVAVLQLGEAAE